MFMTDFDIVVLKNLKIFLKRTLIATELSLQN